MWAALKGSLVIVAFFVAGSLVGLFTPFSVAGTGISTWVLYALMFCVGITLGHDASLAGRVRQLDPRLALLPLATAFGTLLGAAVSALLLPWSVADTLAVGAGFGYYSLSSISLRTSGVPSWLPLPCSATSCVRSSPCLPLPLSPAFSARWPPCRSAEPRPSIRPCRSSPGRPDGPMPWSRSSTGARWISACRSW